MKGVIYVAICIMRENGNGMFNELDAVFKFPTLIDIASKKDRMACLLENPELIQYIKIPTEEEQYVALEKDVNNFQYINRPSQTVIINMVRRNPSMINVLNPLPDYVKDYMTQSAIDNLLTVYENKPLKVIKEVIYILFKRRKSSK